jgi:hypothetical protein
MSWKAIRVLVLAAMAPLAGLAEAQTCALHGPDAASMKAEACLACHGKGGNAAQSKFSHPVDVDYAGVQAARPGGLRPVEEVTRRGVQLPAGEVRCATCHDGRSPWQHYIALPPGAPARVAPDGAHRTSEGGVGELAAAKPGDEVSSKPLCVACHSYD